MVLYYLMVLVMLGIIFLFVHFACKYVEIEHPMEVIIARRISRCEIDKSKKECKIKELKLYKNKDNTDRYKVKIEALKLEIILIEQEMLRLVNYGKC